MWSRVREIVEERGSQIRLNSPVEKVMWETGRVIAVRSEGRVYRAKHFISSIPIRELIEALDPVPPEPCGARLVISTTAISLRWRSLYGAVIYFRTTGFIYTTPGLSVGRIQNYNNWSADMTSDPEMTCLGTRVLLL
jgi:Flavin containing amine oxidoreductase